jgi:transcriptional regulator with XRE-family HTH domain
VNINSSLTKELQDKTYRDAYVASQIRMALPFQVRGLRRARGLNQGEFATRVGMAQPRISEIEKPGERSLNIDTLLRIAAGMDVALQIRFVPFSELIDWSESFDPDNFKIPSFDDELKAAADAVEADAAEYTSIGMLMKGEFDFSPYLKRGFQTVPQADTSKEIRYIDTHPTFRKAPETTTSEMATDYRMPPSKETTSTCLRGASWSLPDDSIKQPRSKNER